MYLYPQTPSLRRGFYRTQGLEDEILILPNTVFDINVNGFRQQYGHYGISAWSGSVRNERMIFAATGIINGSQIYFFVDKINEDIIRETNGEINVSALIVYTIIRHQTFLDNFGRRWTWHRDSRGF